LLSEADKAKLAANEIIDESFRADPTREGIQSEIRSWIRDSARTEGGLAKVREAMDASPEVAAVLYHSPHFLLGITDATRSNMAVDGVIAHLPEAAKLMERSSALTKVAGAYGQTIRSVNASFFNSAVADQMRRRVEA
jgi:hypothetical protein